MSTITVGVLALQGAFSEHLQLLRRASAIHQNWSRKLQWLFIEVRNTEDLERCEALIIPGGESTTMSLVASRSGLLEPLRDFVKVKRKPTWGTCAGLILLSESANRTKKGGQELVGGLDVRVNRNHFGRQVESFEAALDLPFLSDARVDDERPFQAVFIRAPVVEKILPRKPGIQSEEAGREETIVAPSRRANAAVSKDVAEDAEVEVLGRLPGRAKAWMEEDAVTAEDVGEDGDIVAVRQGNVFGTSFHPELTGDERVHVWWLKEVAKTVDARKTQ